MKRGALIVLEGCDKAGKSTQCFKLVEALKRQALPVEHFQFPNRSTPTGALIRNYLEGKTSLDDHCVHLLFSANRWELVPSMVSLLNSGTSLIVDRYAFSGIAYSAAKPGLDFNWCKQPDVGLPAPDLVVYLDLSPEAQQLRYGFGDERYEKLEFQSCVRENYMRLKEKSWLCIKADEPIENVQNIIYSDALKAIEYVSETIQKLWVTKQS